MTTFTPRTARWTVAVLAVVAALVAALLVELRDTSHPSTAPLSNSGREHRDTDTPAALAGPRPRADLAPCPPPATGLG
ncbi:MAG: TlpA family protein disulfide reductase, partial [Mycolicibacterium sp.]|nr:TlpA family protein disulfide reductase [Mycolicibacterium sp.]